MPYLFSACEIARLAAQVEAKGAGFYRCLQSVSQEPQVAEMCAFLAGQETQHETRFLRMAEAHAGSEQMHEYSVDIGRMMKSTVSWLEDFYAKHGPEHGTPADAEESLALAADLEEQSVETYSRMREVYISRFSPLIEKILQEEQQHLRTVAELRNSLGT